MSQLNISYKYQPLFDLLDINYLPEVDIVIMTGGRASGKSFSVALQSVIGLVEYDWNTLYTRYTNMSITDSIKPEVSDKIELLNYENKVQDTLTQICKGSNRIAFKGIKTGSKIQTANLKSLTNFNCFVIDEAEEIPDYDTFKKVYYSIRSTTKRNLTILILNPTTKEHWIFKEFFEKNNLQGGENTVIDNVMFIHTSYLDVERKFIPKNIIRDYEKLKIEDPIKYDNVVVGGWIQDPEGVLLPKSNLHFEDLSLYPKDSVIFSFSLVDPADVGGDKFSNPYIDVVIDNGQIVCLVRDVIHNTSGIEVNSNRVIDKMKLNNTEQIFVESNGVGLAAVIMIKNLLSQHQKMTAFPSTTNKLIRILSHYEFVQKYFVFDKNYESKPEYKLFIHDLTTFTKEGDNKHKADAIDILCGCANVVKVKYRKIIYG